MPVHRLIISAGENEIAETIESIQFAGFDSEYRLGRLILKVASHREPGTQPQASATLAIQINEKTAADLLFGLEELSKFAGWPHAVSIEKQAAFQNEVIAEMQNPVPPKK